MKQVCMQSDSNRRQKKTLDCSYYPALSAFGTVIKFVQLGAIELPTLNAGVTNPVVTSHSSVPITLEHMAVGARRVDRLIPTELTLAPNANAARGSAVLPRIYRSA